MDIALLVILLGSCFLAAGITALLTPLIDRIAKREQVGVYPPNPRTVHRTPIVRIGGIAMVCGFLLTLGASFFFAPLHPLLQRSPFELLRLGLLVVGVLIIAAISLWDDLRPLPPWPRLAVHFLAAFVIVGPYLWDHTLYPDVQGNPTEAKGIILTAFNFPFIHQIHLHNLAPLLAIGATVLWMTVMQNMLNWVDGLDGLAGGVTFIAALVLTVHAAQLGQWTIALLTLILAGACLGFLPFNMHPARLFMGDVGAMTLGYLLAASAILGGAKLATALLVLGMPIIDMAWLIIQRIRQGRSVASAGRDNLHIRLYDLGFTQRQVVWFYYSVSVAFGIISLLDVSPLIKLVALVLLVVLVLGVILYASRRAALRASQMAQPDQQAS